MYSYELSCAVLRWHAALVSHVWQSWGAVWKYCYPWCWRGSRCRIAQLDTLEKSAEKTSGVLNVCHWHSDCQTHYEDAGLLRQRRCGTKLISRLGDLQCLPSYLCTCSGNQIRQAQAEPFCTASSLFQVTACYGLSTHTYLYDIIGPTSGPMRLCRGDRSQV